MIGAVVIIVLMWCLVGVLGVQRDAARRELAEVQRELRARNRNAAEGWQHLAVALDENARLHGKLAVIRKESEE